MKAFPVFLWYNLKILKRVLYGGKGNEKNTFEFGTEKGISMY